ncbi:MAG: site-specific integrase [Brooklawnia sp.]|nr:site-specific integrase [Brooklawnia sp.]
MDPVSIVEAGERAAAVSELLNEFGVWLDRQRGLAPVTVRNYCWGVEQFLVWLPPAAQVSLRVLDAGMVTTFMVEYCRDRNVNSTKSM